MRLNPCAAPLWGGPSGHLAGPIPDTGYEPNTIMDVDSEHTPINLPTRHEFRSPLPRTLLCLDILSIQQQPAVGSPTLLKLGSLAISLTNVSADNESVASRTCIKETCADRDRETVVLNLFLGLCQW